MSPQSERQQAKERAVRVGEAKRPARSQRPVGQFHGEILILFAHKRTVLSVHESPTMFPEEIARYRKQLGVGVATVTLVAALTIAVRSEQDGVPVVSMVPTEVGNDVSSQDEPKIRVEVSGAVVSPSVVQLPEGSRVIDAIEAAGGWGERVDPLRVEVCINLAAPLQDGGAIRIPTLDDRFLLGTTGISCGSLYAPPTEIAASAGVQGSSPTSAPVNLNTATAEQLESLPGIGPVTAAKIIAARKEGPFLVADDLVSRGVISSRVLEQIRPLVSP